MKKYFFSRYVLLSGVLFVALVVANVVYYLGRDWEASFYPSSYATLYYAKDVPSVESWTAKSPKELQLNVSWNQKADTWKLTIDGENSQILEGANPVIPLVDENMKYHSYALTPMPVGRGRMIEVRIRSIPKSYYMKGGLTSHKHEDLYTIKSNGPVGKFEQYSVSDWVDDYSYVDSDDLAEVDRAIREDAGVEESDSTFEKMEKLTRYLRSHLEESRGIPRDDFRWMNACQIFNEMADGGDKGWCTQFGQIWTFYANRAGIPTRLVSGARSQDSHLVLYTGHTWAESYIVDQDRWAFVDLTHSNIYVTDKNGLVLNSAELLHLAQHEAFDGLLARIYKDFEWADLLGEAELNTLTTVPFTDCSRVVKQEFTELSIFKYRQPPNVEDVRNFGLMFKDAAFGWGNVERYLFNSPLAYSMYPTNGAIHILFVELCSSVWFLACWFLSTRFGKRSVSIGFRKLRQGLNLAPSLLEYEPATAE